MSITGI